MRRWLKFGLPALLFGITLQSATLERLSIDDMARKSTAIVRARISGSYTAQHGSFIYTHYKAQVTETWKGAATVVDFAVPGGVLGPYRQVVSGAPRLAEGSEYVLFLWAGSSGLTQLVGLSQGVLSLVPDKNGELVATRAASRELMLDSRGRLVTDQAISIRLNDLRGQVRTMLDRAEGSAR
jgi:hypothetical protein